MKSSELIVTYSLVGEVDRIVELEKELQLAGGINESIANVVLLLLLSVCFLLLIGSFFKEEEYSFFLEKGPWRTMFMVIMFVGIVVIFLNAFN